MVPVELAGLMQSIWYQDHIVTHLVHAYVPLIVVMAQVSESSAAVAEAAAGVADTAAIVVDVAMDIVAPSEVIDILAETDHGLACCLSLSTYHVLL